MLQSKMHAHHDAAIACTVDDSVEHGPALHQLPRQTQHRVIHLQLGAHCRETHVLTTSTSWGFDGASCWRHARSEPHVTPAGFSAQASQPRAGRPWSAPQQLLGAASAASAVAANLPVFVRLPPRAIAERNALLMSLLERSQRRWQRPPPPPSQPFPHPLVPA